MRERGAGEQIQEQAWLVARRIGDQKVRKAKEREGTKVYKRLKTLNERKRHLGMGKSQIKTLCAKSLFTQEIQLDMKEIAIE